MTTEIRDRLAAPFPEQDVKWRPGAAKWDHKPACEGARCRDARDSEKHMQFAYVEDEAVMSRLDDALGLGTWQWHVQAISDSVVLGRLTIVSPTTGDAIDFEDFGYGANGLEPLKEATTDALRRVARFVGVARYIYAGELETQAHRPTPPRPAAHPAGDGSPRPSPADYPDDGPPPEDEYAGIPAAAARIFGETADSRDHLCPVHHQPWKRVPGGTSRTKTDENGQPLKYSAFWSCPERDCRIKPSQQWAAENRA